MRNFGHSVLKKNHEMGTSTPLIKITLFFLLPNKGINAEGSREKSRLETH